uniref:REP element-mobilizing transposase RayT n=1 Tax=Candidatus Kentrum sp. DK TaxID=2126562 RepID=A0A450SAP4_9GAMM|nr:MAG: REP element-mobilizing transposase RayT [Candidatus Kentron sp. DK]VFJ49185.1 MAG: REP element-mobilizing transposase RayT [Candidatus Kentron sp. DK]
MPQSLSNILLHLVFSTKSREPHIYPEIEPELYAYIASIHKNLACPLLKIGGTSNHLHILCRLERVVTVSKLLEEIKKSSSKWIKTKDAGLGNFAWQAGYGAFSIGMSNVPALERYIEMQKQHHEKLSFEDEYRALLRKYKIEWDENHVWA